MRHGKFKYEMLIEPDLWRIDRRQSKALSDAESGYSGAAVDVDGAGVGKIRS